MGSSIESIESVLRKVLDEAIAMRGQLQIVREKFYANPNNELLRDEYDQLKTGLNVLNNLTASFKAVEERAAGAAAGGSGGGQAPSGLLESQQRMPVEVRCVQRFHRPVGAEPCVLDPEEVKHLIRAGESSVVDFKEVRVAADGKFMWSNKEIAIAASGFANSAMGGVLLCGITDKTREVTGVPEMRMEDFKHHVSQALGTCASPSIKHALSSVPVQNSVGEHVWVVAVDIPPGFQLTQVGEEVYQRHGDENVRKRGVNLQDLRQGWNTMRGRMDAGDAAPVQRAVLSTFLNKHKLERLDLGWLAADSPGLAQHLCNLRLAAYVNSDEVVLTVAGLLLLSKVEDWQKMLVCPSYSVQIQVFNNDDRPGTPLEKYNTDIYYSVDILGDALSQVDRAMDVITHQTMAMYEKRIIKDEEGRTIVRGFQHTLYPSKAIQELLVNAIVHRTYRENSGKIVVRVRHRSLEIVVPGEFLPGITPNNIGTKSTCSLPRNPVLANFMHEIHREGRTVKVFEGHGLGVARARRHIEESGGTLKYRSVTGAVMVMVTAAPTPQNSPTSSSV